MALLSVNPKASYSSAYAPHASFKTARLDALLLSDQDYGVKLEEVHNRPLKFCDDCIPSKWSLYIRFIMARSFVDNTKAVPGCKNDASGLPLDHARAFAGQYLSKSILEQLSPLIDGVVSTEKSFGNSSQVNE
jgi:hypothetical protein